MEELAYHLGAGLGMSAIFFPLAYLALRKQLQLRFSWAQIAIAFAVSTALLGLLAGVTHNDAKPSYFDIARLIIAPLLCAGVIVGARVNSDRKNGSVRHGTLILSFAILIATYCIASVFRYQYFPNGALRTDRWTGETQINCIGQGLGWTSSQDCSAAVQLQSERESQFIGAIWDNPNEASKGQQEVPQPYIDPSNVVQDPEPNRDAAASK